MQEKLFENEENNWKNEWIDMPEYNNKKQEPPLITATFKFKTKEDFLKFKDLLQKYVYNGAKVFDGMQKKEAKNAWYPHKEKASKYEYL
tara:strand:+ start:264 stop:530 length:267 start_codon:yes stop_codon:yes gene_type:complete